MEVAEVIVLDLGSEIEYIVLCQLERACGGMVVLRRFLSNPEGMADAQFNLISATSAHTYILPRYHSRHTLSAA
jgi:hypothetical protein